MSTTTKPDTGNTPNTGNKPNTGNISSNVNKTPGNEPAEGQGGTERGKEDRQPGTQRQGAEDTQMGTPGQGKSNSDSTGAGQGNREQQDNRARSEQGSTGRPAEKTAPAQDEDAADRRGPAAGSK